MVFGAETSPAVAFQKDAFDLTVEEVYNISYVIGRDLRKISGLERSAAFMSVSTKQQDGRVGGPLPGDHLHIHTRL
uniref:Uncharacterized protein n=1 Tax=Knipowitschia caucasica TaxID=637954 RepID=A0AAV2JEH9_KNICA